MVPLGGEVEYVADGGVEHGGVDGADRAGDAERGAEAVDGRRRHAAPPQRCQRVQPRVVPVYNDTKFFGSRKTGNFLSTVVLTLIEISLPLTIPSVISFAIFLFDTTV